LQDLLPGIISQLGPDNLEDLKKIYASAIPTGAAPKKGAAADDDDDVPELVDQNFEVGFQTACSACSSLFLLI
jgi:hypothetical protein